MIGIWQKFWCAMGLFGHWISLPSANAYEQELRIKLMERQLAEKGESK